MIRRINRTEIPRCAEVIRKSFATVAADYGITRENTPRHTSFITDERLYEQFDNDRPMFALFEEKAAVGYFSLEKKDEKTYELNNLAVLPEKRHLGFGKQLLDFASDLARQLGAEKITIGIIDENEQLKKWYADNGFVYLGSHKFPNFVFTAGFMEKYL